MVTTSRVNKLLSWQAVLAALDVAVDSAAIPCAAACPVCRGDGLGIHQDTTQGGYWHYCRRCGSAGDMVELSARAWQVDEKEAIDRLLRLGLLDPGTATSEAVTDYLERTLAQRRDAENFWRRSSAELPLAPPDLRAFRMHATIAVGSDPSRWKERGGQFIGAARRDDIAGALWPNFRHTVNVFGRARPEWSHAWVLPVRDLPGRLSGFVLLAGDAVVCRSIGHTRPHVYEPGVAMLEALDHRDGRFDGLAFAMLDPVVALRIQLAYLSQPGGSVPLPVVGVWPDSPPCRYLAEATTGRVIFWAERMTTRLLVHARAAGGLVAVQDSSESGIDLVQRRGAVGWLGRLKKAAVPWYAALGEASAGMSDVEIDDVFRVLALHNDELDRVLEGCPVVVRRRLDEIYNRRFQHRRVRVNGQVVVETPRGWVVERNGELISSAVIRLERVIHQPRSRKTFYQGHVLFRGQSYDFTAPDKSFDRSPLKWVSDHLVRRGVTALPDYNQRWESSIANVIRQFGRAEVIRGLDGYGWDADSGGFVLPSYAIGRDGCVLFHGLPRPARSHLPATNLKPPEDLTSREVTLLAGQPLVWATAACVLHNLLAPMLGYPTRGVAVVNGGGFVADVAVAMGCAYTGRYNRDAGKAASRADDRVDLGWPLAMPARPRSAVWSHWLAADGHNCLVTDMARLPAMTCLAGDNWLVVDCPVGVRPTAAVLAAAVKVIPGVLRHVMTSRYDGRGGGGRFKHACDLLSRWYTGQGGDGYEVAAGQALVTPRPKFDTLVAILVMLAAQGRRCGEPGPSGDVLVDLDEVNDALEALRWPTLNPERVDEFMAYKGRRRGGRWAVPAAALAEAEAAARSGRIAAAVTRLW